jgi:hypothetical protein
LNSNFLKNAFVKKNVVWKKTKQNLLNFKL